MTEYHVERQPTRVFRHEWNTRICHWVNAVAIGFLFVSGWAILLDYPELYWGQVGFFGHEPAFRLADWGITLEGNRQWGRNIHFLYAWVFTINGLVYLIWNFARRRAREKLLPTREQLTLEHLRTDIGEHLRLRTPRGAAAARYGSLQKLAYLGVLFFLAPLMVLSGLAQSPAVVAGCPELLELFGGKQSARTIHFIGMLLFVLFFLVHVFQVFLMGAVNEIRAMVTGWFRLPEQKP